MFFRRKIIKFIIFLIFLSINSYSLAQSIPPATELISQKKSSDEKVESVISDYSSSLSKDEILSFYRKLFSSQKMQEVRISSVPNIVSFERYPFSEKTIIFTDSKSQNRICYSLEEKYYKKIPILPTLGFTPPTRLDFAPTISNAMQFVYSTAFYPMIGVWYLSYSEPEEISNFYIKNMPSFGWELVSSLPNSGVYNFYRWFLIVDPFSKALPMLKERDYEEFIPPLSIRGVTLTFKQSEKSLTITIYKFEDIVEKARGTVWDAYDFVKYGRCVIGMFYFQKKVN